MEKSVGYTGGMTSANQLEKDLRQAAHGRTPEDIAFIGRFFKSYKGGYSEGDVFIGATVPLIRAVCKKYKSMALAEIEKALESPTHETRLAAVIIMVNQAKKASPQHKKALFDLYLRRTDRINNWDIVDASCRDVVGEYLLDKPKGILYELARSDSLWERRIAMVSTWAFIRQGQVDDTFKMAALLLTDKHDLIHKAVGWMLREAGKKVGQAPLKAWLDKYYKHMPRTALRYAIEHFDPATRQNYLKK